MKNAWLISLVILCSCSASRVAHRKLAKADKLIKQAIALGAEVKQDTVFVDRVIQGETTRVEIPIEKLVHLRHDTTIYQDRIKLNYRLLHDTLRLTVDCPPDTIRVPVTVHQSIVAPECPKDKFWKGFGMGAGLLLILLIVLGVVRALK